MWQNPSLQGRLQYHFPALPLFVQVRPGPRLPGTWRVPRTMGAMRRGGQQRSPPPPPSTPVTADSSTRSAFQTRFGGLGPPTAGQRSQSTAPKLREQRSKALKNGATRPVLNAGTHRRRTGQCLAALLLCGTPACLKVDLGKCRDLRAAPRRPLRSYLRPRL
ncbi:hypothetical protein SKAU_G00139590 [Synaphobranchus kaupii]|uniref:Uncharacterized protein n=1 Tax=Synaphobranchus kaupii TaxID=118154 RepID=A0A9Q1FS56_SYNKA|nr:hypothetical protein SKAU_G00139590 [Synaphobranchus kaupii]